MTFSTRTLVLAVAVVVLSLQIATAYPNVDSEDSIQLFPLVQKATTMGFESCKLALFDVVNHFKEIQSVGFEYVRLTVHATTESARCFFSKKESVSKCISDVMKEHKQSYDLLHESFKTLAKSLLRSLKTLSTCAFN